MLSLIINENSRNVPALFGKVTVAKRGSRRGRSRRFAICQASNLTALPGCTFRLNNHLPKQTVEVLKQRIRGNSIERAKFDRRIGQTSH